MNRWQPLEEADYHLSGIPVCIRMYPARVDCKHDIVHKFMPAQLGDQSTSGPCAHDWKSHQKVNKKHKPFSRLTLALYSIYSRLEKILLT